MFQVLSGILYLDCVFVRNKLFFPWILKERMQIIRMATWSFFTSWPQGKNTDPAPDKTLAEAINRPTRQ